MSARLKLSVTAATAAAIGILSGNPAAAEVGDLRALRVVDSDGKTVGRWVDDTVVMSVDGKVVAVGIVRISRTNPRLTWTNSGGNLFFVSTDCTGAGHLSSNYYQAPFGTTPAVLRISNQGRALLYVGSGMDPKPAPLVYNSILDEAGCRAGQFQHAFDAWVFKSPPIDLDARLKVPLYIK